MTRTRRYISLVAIMSGACTPGDADDASAQQQSDDVGTATTATCDVVELGRPLPSEIRETSGLARSPAQPDRFWTHNDAGNAPVLFAIDESGRIVQGVRVTGASLVDWEDIEAGPCPEGGACLYVADIGDNDAERERVTVYRVREPDPAASATAPAEAFHARFPDGPRDAESLFALGDGSLYLVTKGRRDEIVLYRYPLAEAGGAIATLQRVRTLFPEPGDKADRVTSATATPDGRWVGVRTADTFYLYPAHDLVSGADVTPIAYDLGRLGEAQGESIVIANDGSVWLSSEAENRSTQPTWSRLRCELPPSRTSQERSRSRAAVQK